MPQFNDTSKIPLVLVVDDQERNIQMVESTLAERGYAIIPATSGEVALERLQTKRPDLILLDILMPDMDGFEVCRKLQANPDTADIPVIFLSAADEQDIIIRALEAGGADYVTKPFNKAELLLRVQTHVELADARERMQDLLDMREEFISILAHDLKNPLSSIRFGAQWLTEKGEQLPASAQKISTSILDSSNQMFEFIENFLSEKSEARGTLSVDLQSLDLVEACKASLKRHEAAAVNKRIRMRFDKPEGAVMAHADTQALAHLLDNLISNALKFSARDKEVSVRIDHANGIPSLAITDQGPGFTPEDRDQLWMRFVRLSAKPTAGETSTGLGLSIVKRLVEMMHADIALESVPGDGATFRIEFKKA
ncbi:MAG: two-component system sensor histidine kinase/response regulator [Verrucomicrobiales bacterium]|jgi:two-component system sensor histidine kinase/response regulator